MNKIDQHIKRMMLRYPLLFPNRINCLYHLFLVNGNGYRWNAAGELEDRCNTYADFDGKMNYSDLDEDMDRLLSSKQDFPDHPIIQELNDGRELKNHEERMVRQFREQHIDKFCRDIFGRSTDGNRFTTEMLLHVDLNWSAFKNAPYGSIDHEWLMVAESVIDKLDQYFNSVWNLYYDRPTENTPVPNPSMFSRMPEQLQRLHTQMLAVKNQLDEQSGTSSRLAEQYNRVLEMLNAK